MAKTTIDDVAKRAGVSIKTVSRVINREPNVREQTRERVLQAVTELDYRPNQSARRLAGSRSFLIALVYDNPSASYVINVQTGVLEQCQSNSIDLLIHPCGYEDDDLVSSLQAMIRHSNIDGIILTPPLSDTPRLLDALDDWGTPYVKLSPGTRSDKQRSIYTNDVSATEQLVAHLAELGHRKIGYIAGHPDHYAVVKRLEGFKRGMQAVGLPIQEAYIRQGFNSMASGVDCAKQLLDLPDPPTAIAAANDEMAVGALNVAHDRGLSVPQQLSVAGFEDIPLASQVWPALTTVDQPVSEMANLAARLLLDQIEEKRPEQELYLVESTLQVRQTTGPAPS